MKQYLTVGDLRKLLEGVDERYIVYIRADYDSAYESDVFLTDEQPKTQDAHRVWDEDRDADFIRLYGFTES